ncbi:TPA: transposase, partial [Staphylococcus aureus]|nr:transposase [Staphylococcus aureus]HDB4718306.1 transposase [Staphylococcus aureus]
FAKGGKYLGKGVAGVGFGIGMYDDLANDNKTFGEALSHNGMTLAAGSVAAFGVAALVSNPVGWAVVGILTAGIIGSTVSDYLYQNNYFGIKDKVDWAGHKIDEGIDAVNKTAEKAVDSVGNAIGDATKSISNHINPMKWSW